MESIVARLRSLINRTHIIIQLDTLEYLRRSGRAEAIMPILERFVRVLSIKPLMTFIDGELCFMGVARSYQKGIERIQREIASLGALECLAVMHTRRQSAAEQLADELAGLTNVAREHIWVGETGPVISCHGGAGIIAAVGVRRQDNVQGWTGCTGSS